MTRGCKDMAQRIVNAEDGFLEVLMERGLTREDAVKAMRTLLGAILLQSYPHGCMIVSGGSLNDDNDDRT